MLDLSHIEWNTPPALNKFAGAAMGITSVREWGERMEGGRTVEFCYFSSCTRKCVSDSVREGREEDVPDMTRTRS
jgi:hypothetical protein